MEKIFIQGLGFVGAAMATAVADVVDKDGHPLYNVTGVELDNTQGQKTVLSINSGIFPFNCEDASLKCAFKNAIQRGNLRATTDEEQYALADIVIVDVNLDLIEQDTVKTVSWGSFKQAIKTLGEHIRQDTLVIVETTVPPGTCEYVVLPILRECFIERGISADKVLLAHSYERVMPGKHYLSSIKNFWRVYAGCSEEASRKCESFLRTVVNTEAYPLTQLSSPCASETAKVMENSYRAANIAFIEEWATYAQHTGVDLFEIIDAIKMRPTHRNMMYPGFGVGGYCLTKDPLFARVSARELFNTDMAFPFCEMAVETNNAMPKSAVTRLEGLLGDFNGKQVLLMGISYRQDVGDTRHSPAETFARALKIRGAKLVYHDPYIQYWHEMSENVTQTLPNLCAFDAIVLAVAHREYKDIDFNTWLKGSSTCVLDANNVLTARQRDDMKALPNRFACIGRG